MTREERIRERAHQIWETEGRPHGRDRDHWERACREIEASSASSAGGMTAPRSTSQGMADAGTPGGRATQGRQAAATSDGGLVGADDIGTGAPDAMAVDDLKVAGGQSDPNDRRPAGSRSKLVGS